LVRVVAARGEAAALGAVTPRAVTVVAVMVMVMVTVEAAAAVKGGLRLRCPRRGAVTTAIGTGAAAVGMAAITMVGNFLDQSWLP
jgi:hypothetical protein